MEPRLIILGIVFAILSTSCKAPAYLPEAEEIDINEFGSHISVNLIAGSDIEGELITIDKDTLNVLTREKDITQLRSISIADVKSFKLMYAQSENYAWTIPVSALVTLSHGYFSVITAPVNIIVTSIVTARAANAFTYNEKTMSWEDLKMFARFPQGFPTNVRVAELR